MQICKCADDGAEGKMYSCLAEAALSSAHLHICTFAHFSVALRTLN